MPHRQDPEHHHGHHHGRHDEQHASPRHRGGGPNGIHGGRGRGARGPGGFGFDDEGGMPRGRKLSSDDLQLLLLALLAEASSHGYELIKALEARSNGFYVPSPGMVYPALAYLEDRGHVTVQLEGTRKRYSLADEGRAHLDANRERADQMLARLQQAAERMARMRSAMAGEEGDDGARWTAELAEARRALGHALHAYAGAPAGEQQRIAAILARATAEITADGGAG